MGPGSGKGCTMDIDVVCVELGRGGGALPL